MYSKDEYIIFSLLNTYEEKINANFFYKIFKISILEKENIFKMSNKKLLAFLNEKCLFNETQILKIMKFLNKDFIKSLDIKNVYLECEKNNIQILSQIDREYPKNFLKIKRPPYVIYLKGKLPEKNKFKHIVALVGTRKLSLEGEEFAKNIAEFLKKENIFNVSGLAIGADTVGHKICLGKTGAILGQGLALDIYPNQNKDLANKILENNGFLLSELPPLTKVSRNNLIQRNRLQVALADFIVIIETVLKGGTVHTFKYATQEKKDIYIAKFNNEFINKYKKYLITIENSNDLEFNLKLKKEQKTLF